MGSRFKSDAERRAWIDYRALREERDALAVEVEKREARMAALAKEWGGKVPEGPRERRPFAGYRFLCGVRELFRRSCKATCDCACHWQSEGSHV